MTKYELLDYLDERLAVLNDREREDIKQEYSQHIDMKMRDGMTEVQAVESLGDISAIVDEILMAYNIDPGYRKKAVWAETGEKNGPSANSEMLRRVSEKAKNGINAAGRLVRVNTPFGMLKALIKIFAFCIVTFAVFVFGFMIFEMIAEVLNSNLPSLFMLDDIVAGGVILLYIMIFMLVVGGFVWNYLNTRIGRAKKIIKEEGSYMSEVYSTDAGGADAPRKRGSTAESLWDIVLFIVKFCILWALIPCFFTFLFTVVAQGVLIAALFSGYPVVGLSVGCLGTNMCLAAFLTALIRFMFYKKGDGVNETR